MTSWVINGEKGMTGTVELLSYGLKWHITSPVQLNVSYGGSDSIPATYVDSQGKDQMVAIVGSGVYFDENYTAGVGELFLPLNKVKITSLGDSITRRVSIVDTDVLPIVEPIPNNNIWWYILILILIILMIGDK